MKIQCDVCNNEEATVFCSADEAALCDRCDWRVHHANKLATKHKRHALLRPTAKDFPFCDICQERRGLIFCREDRAILCKECDLRIHKCNEHTQKHDRFLLTGVKLSASSSSPYPSPLAFSGPSTVANMATKGPESSMRKQDQQLSTKQVAPSQAHPGDIRVMGNNYSSSPSSISEYFTKTLPGWHVEDFLNFPLASFNGYCKVCETHQLIGKHTDGLTREN